LSAPRQLDVAIPATIRLDAAVDRLVDVRRFVRDVAPGLGADDRAVHDLVQAVDEWVTNVIVHGYRGAGGPIEVELTRAGSDVVARIRDAAPAFDPDTAPTFDPSLPLERRPFGRMGIHLIRELSDRFEHRPRPGGGNEIAIYRTVDEATKQAGGKA